jgi:uncharacterized protein (TIGR02265 family)
MNDFNAPDWNQPINLAAHLEAIPDNLTNNGVVFHSLVKIAKEKNLELPRKGKYHSFSKYPVSEFVQLLVDTAQASFPDVPVRQAIRQLGWNVFPGLKESAAGRFLFSVAGSNYISAIRLIGKAFELFSCVNATAKTESDNLLFVELRNAWSFPENYQVGVFEGGLKTYGKTGEITVKKLSACDVDLRIEIK